VSPTDEVAVELVSVVDDELRSALAALVPQLSGSAPPVRAYDLESIVDAPATSLFVARVRGVVVGMLTLAIFRVPTGMRAWIEDVVVDEAARGAGAGGALVAAALAEAAEAGARTVDLTSRPERAAANRLYQRMGFVTRQTNVYRRSLDGTGGG
jgi:ribosomal protein S18 acetylase RimI-like enzyme